MLILANVRKHLSFALKNIAGNEVKLLLTHNFPSCRFVTDRDTVCGPLSWPIITKETKPEGRDNSRPCYVCFHGIELPLLHGLEPLLLAA